MKVRYKINIYFYFMKQPISVYSLFLLLVIKLKELYYACANIIIEKLDILVMLAKLFQWQLLLIHKWTVRLELIYIDIKSLSPEYIFYIVKIARRRCSGLYSYGCFRNKNDTHTPFLERTEYGS